MSLGAGAVGVVGEFRYNHPTTHYNPNYTLWIAFPNHAQLDQGGYVQDSWYHSGTVLHEIAHNPWIYPWLCCSCWKIGYDCSISVAYRNVAKNKVFLEKYKKELASFKPFYATKHTDLLQENTRTARSLSLDNLITYNIDEIIEVCIVYEDGTYEIRKMKNGQFI